MAYNRQLYLYDIAKAIPSLSSKVHAVIDPLTGNTWQAQALYGPGAGYTYDPLGVVVHHTASVAAYPEQPWYPVSKLRTSCNVNIKPDGTIYIISAGYQRDTGYGDGDVLYALRTGAELPRPRDTYDEAGRPAGRNPGISMNPWFIDIECDHPGDGRLITSAQIDALTTYCAAILNYKNWPTRNLIGHKEITRRKIDPFWNNDLAAMESVRARTNEKRAELIQGAPVTDTYKDFVAGWVSGLDANHIDKLFDSGIVSGLRSTWINLLDDPSNPEWLYFYTRAQVTAWSRTIMFA